MKQARNIGLLSFAMFLFMANAVSAATAELLVAIRNGDHSRVQKLLSAGADGNTVDGEGTTALMHSVVEADATMMTLLIDRGANVNVKNKRGVTPMSVAVTAPGSTPVLKLLVSKGAEPEDRLMAAVAGNGDLEAIQFLLSIGVRPGDAGTVSAAITARCEACARLLVEKGAPANGVRQSGAAVGSTGGGVLNDAAKRAMPELSQFLLDHGASLESRDREGFNLLMQAVLSMEPPPARDRMVEWLLSKGADPNAKNDRGDTAYALAARVGIPSTLDLLMKAGAKAVQEARPKPAGNPLTAEAAVKKILPLIETSGDPVFKHRACVSCHNNSLPA